MRSVLTIAGSDPSGGAGIQGDLKTFAALGVYGASAVTAITTQNTNGVISHSALSADLVSAQIDAVASDIEVHATKIGMLADAAIVEAVAASIEELELPRVVLDPLVLSKNGYRLLDDEGFRILIADLLPLAMVVTPNLPEAEALTGRPVVSLTDAHDAARRIHALGAAAVIVTGGHRSGDEVIDVLFDGTHITELTTSRVAGRNTHGTGCAFSSAVAAFLARGHELADAATRAQHYVAGAIRHAPALGKGYGPLNHFWQHAADR